MALARLRNRHRRRRRSPGGLSRQRCRGCVVTSKLSQSPAESPSLTFGSVVSTPTGGSSCSSGIDHLLKKKSGTDHRSGASAPHPQEQEVHQSGCLHQGERCRFHDFFVSAWAKWWKLIFVSSYFLDFKAWSFQRTCLDVLLWSMPCIVVRRFAQQGHVSFPILFFSISLNPTLLNTLNLDS